MVPNIGLVSKEVVVPSSVPVALAAGILEAPAASQRAREARQAGIAIARLAPKFTEELHARLVRDLLIRLEAERKARDAQNLNHWEQHAKERIYAIAEQLLNERGARVAAYLKANGPRLGELAFRVTRDRAIAGEVVIQTIWEYWHGRTFAEVLDRALIMNSRERLRSRKREYRRRPSLDGMISQAAEQGESLDFASHRIDDQDPMEVLLAREDQREFDDEMDYTMRVVRCEGNRWILKKDWWKESRLSAWEKRSWRTEFRGSGE